jgi:hypothetical protein
MFTTSRRTLNILAALIWYLGGIILLLKGFSLLGEARSMKPGLLWPWLAPIVGFGIGGVQAKYIFSKSCEKNLARIAALDRPKVWQFFRPGFFAALAVMILTGAILSRLAHNSYSFLIGVAIVDHVVAASLLGSSIVFWKKKAFHPTSKPDL